MTDFSPIPDANPQVTEKAGSTMAAVCFSRALAPSEFLQLAQAVGEQHVRQLLISEAGQVARLLQLQLGLWGTGQPAGGSCVFAFLSRPCCRLLWWFAPAEGKRMKG